MRISQLAQLSGVPAPTLCFSDGSGLFAELFGVAA